MKKLYFLLKSKKIPKNFSVVNIFVQSSLGDNFLYFQLAEYLSEKFKVNIITESKLFVNFKFTNKNIQILDMDLFDSSLCVGALNWMSNLSNKIYNIVKSNGIKFNLIVFNQTRNHFESSFLKLIHIILGKKFTLMFGKHLFNLLNIFDIKIDKSICVKNNTKKYNVFLNASTKEKSLNYNETLKLILVLWNENKLLPVFFGKTSISTKYKEELKNVGFYDLTSKTNDISTLVSSVSEAAFSLGCDTGLTHISLFKNLPTICIKNNEFKNLYLPVPGKDILEIDIAEKIEDKISKIKSYLQKHKIV